MSASPKKPVTVTDATVSITEENHQGTVVNLSRAAGIVATLPEAVGSGHEYEFFVLTTVTSNAYTIAALTTDIIQGGVAVSTDAAGVTVLTAADSDKISMNGSTTGGLIGSHVRLKDVADGIWRVEGFLRSTGAEATPFAAT